MTDGQTESLNWQLATHCIVHQVHGWAVKALLGVFYSLSGRIRGVVPSGWINRAF